MIVQGKIPGLNTSSASLNTTNTSAVLCSKADEARFLKSLESQNRIERIKQVRSQEKENAKLGLLRQQERQALEHQQLEEQQKYQAYLHKKQQIEELTRLRQLELERTGKAMRDAEEAEERRLREELDRKEKAIRDQAA